MKKYKIKITKRYNFTLTGESRDDVNDMVDTIINESRILDLPHVRKNIKVKIKEVKNGISNQQEDN